jgi:hypothetical protein
MHLQDVSCIGAIHLAEVDAVRSCVDRLFDMNPPAQSTMEDSVSSNFQLPFGTTSEVEWSSQGSKQELL